MIVLDTHAWLWHAGAPERLGRRARAALRRAPRIGVPSIAVWEVARLVAERGLHLDREVGDWIHQALALPAVELLPVTPEIAVAASRLHGVGADPADRLIAGTAQVHAAKLVTKDRQLRAAPVSRRSGRAGVLGQKKLRTSSDHRRRRRKAADSGSDPIGSLRRGCQRSAIESGALDAKSRDRLHSAS